MERSYIATVSSTPGSVSTVYPLVSMDYLTLFMVGTD